MKTVVKQILDNRDKNFDANKFIKWLDENRRNLLHLEEQQIINAHSAGVWDCVPHEQYYEETYKL